MLDGSMEDWEFSEQLSMQQAIESLRTQLAECQRERDAHIEAHEKMYALMCRTTEQLFAVTTERDEATRLLNLAKRIAADPIPAPGPSRVEILTERLAAMTAERDELLGPNPVEAYLKEQLAAMTAERDELKARMNAGGHLTVAWNELAVAQALCQQYREALKYLVEDLELRAKLNPDPDERDIVNCSDGAYRKAYEALDTPHPQAALYSAIAEELERMAEVQCARYGGIGVLPFELQKRAKELREMK